jgi:hypothetical protein
MTFRHYMNRTPMYETSSSVRQMCMTIDLEVWMIAITISDVHNVVGILVLGDALVTIPVDFLATNCSLLNNTSSVIMPSYINSYWVLTFVSSSWSILKQIHHNLLLWVWFQGLSYRRSVTFKLRIIRTNEKSLVWENVVKWDGKVTNRNVPKRGIICTESFEWI